MLKRLAAVAALMVVPFATIAPVYAAPAAPETEKSADADEEDEEEEDDELEVVKAGDVGTFGYSVGVDPGAPWQFSNAFSIRHSPWGEWSEAALGLNTRSQVIDPTRTYAFEMTGLNLQLGVKAWFLRLGVLGEIDWVRRISQANGQLNWDNRPGFSVEPYIGSTLPFLRTAFTSLDARVYVPIGRYVPTVGFLTPDPAVGPRLMLTLWVGMPDMPDGDEEEEEEEEQSEEEGTSEEEEESAEDEEAPEPEATPVPAPRQPAKPTPTPTAKPTPKPPAKPLPKK